MKIVIAYSNTKRYIRGAFELCGTPEELKSIAHQILKEVDSKGALQWIRIHDESIVPCLTGIHPKEWDE